MSETPVTRTEIRDLLAWLQRELKNLAGGSNE